MVNGNYNKKIVGVVKSGKKKRPQKKIELVKNLQVLFFCLLNGKIYQDQE